MARTVKVGLDVDEKPYVAGVGRAERATERLDDAVDDLGTSAKATTAGMGKAKDTIGDTGDKARTTAREFDKLSDEIRETEARVKSLADQIRRTGPDADLLNKFGAEEAKLAKLARVRRALGEIGEEVVKVGAKSARFTLSGLTDAVESLPQQLKGALIIGGAAAVTAAAPLIGGALTGAIVGGVSSGAIAAGIASAARSSEVKAAWTALASQGQTVFAEFGKPFVEPTVEAIGILSDALGDIRGDLDAIGVDAAKLVAPLARGVGDFVRQMMPGIRALAREAGPVFAMLRDELPNLGRAVGRFFESLGEGAEGGALALKALLRITEGTLVVLGDTLEQFANTVTMVAVITDKFGGALDFAFGDGRTAKIKGRGTETKAVFDAISHSARNAADRVGELNQRFDDLFDKQMNLDQANVDFKLGLIELGETLKSNNEDIDNSTERWLANQDALLGMIREADGVRDAAIEMGNGTEEASAKANAAYDAQLEQIRKVGEAFGLPISKINELIERYKSLHFMPNIVKTVIFERHDRVAGGPRGTIIAQAKGGIVAAQEGMIATSPTVLFGERETGVEAFIPQRGISRQRGMALGAEAMRWHQASVVPNEQLAALGSGDTYVFVTIDGQQLEGRITRVVREHNRQVIRRADAGAGRR